MDNKIRLQKHISQAGYASRRKAEELIKNGKVMINNKVAKLGHKVDPATDIIKINEKALQNPDKHAYIMINKPKATISTAKEQFGRASVVDLVDPAHGRLYPIGRLDYNTTGLLLLTNDGELTYKLTHPKHSIKKVYTAILSKPITSTHITAFLNGINIDGYTTKPAELTPSKQNPKLAKIIIYEGKNRQIHRMFAVLGINVLDLTRIAIGNLKLGNLQLGEYRHLTKQEVQSIL